MLKKAIFLIIICYLFTLNLIAQQNDYKIIKYFKAYQLDSVKSAIKNISYSFSKKIFEEEYNYLQNGLNNKIDFFSPKNYIDSALYYNQLGNYYSRKISPNDTISFKNYKESLLISKKHHDTLLINICLLKINEHYLKNYKDKSLNIKYLKELNNYKKDEIDIFWSKYFNLVFDMTYSSFSKEDFKKLEKRFLDLLKSAPSQNPYFEARIKNMISIFYSYSNTNNDLVRKYCEETILLTSDKYFYSQMYKNRARINVAICDYEEEKYKEAIQKLTYLLKNRYIKEDLEVKKYIYDWIYKSYKKLKIIDSSQFYLELKISVKDSLKQYQFAEKIRDIDTKYEVTETKEQLNNQTNQTKTLKTKLNTVLPILAAITLLLGFVYFRYKKYHKKSENLEEEKSETLTKLEELKEIVIKNHIVLKDKTKIYITDLMYIKSDDHYLKIFLSNGKNHFVRGKLTKIIEELPPNFIRCHRSYVVNRNYIKQINNTNIILTDKTELPLSRSYKDKLK